ncbi:MULTISPECIES: AraC family transcriptional regulator [unclassified Beijerinckia]|uniref:AraC family transcriptional regulator n=1 Tax=unclassified Beijerinckia TaxID=2638183 RepID=UPI00089C53EC|nr:MULTISPECIES: AraC family transcriptional regulator [unclassified Beijerinckia]MDH7794850.1 AraC family transcriptional regulator [Beijerinckia sp. GAS462]SEB77711.1 AraC-type DNA-binding protein [Beijerinckia sp. 28-YEA-48]
MTPRRFVQKSSDGTLARGDQGVPVDHTAIGLRADGAFRRTRGPSAQTASKEGGHGVELLLTNQSGDVRLMYATYAAKEGEFAKLSDTWIHLCRDGGGHLYRTTDRNRLDGQMRPGVIALAGPDARVVGSWPSMSLLSLGISTNKLGAIIADLHRQGSAGLIDYSRFYQDPLLEQLLIAIAAEAETHALSTLFIEHALTLLVLRLTSMPPKNTEGALSPRQLIHVCDFIAEHLSNDISLPALASITGLSTAEFSRRFKTSTGEAPYAYVTHQRIRRAMWLLRDASVSIDSIAKCVGYLNGSQFARAFQRVVGRSPTHWRREDAAHS